MPPQKTVPSNFQPLKADANGTVTWIHLGDLHMKTSGDQNELDLGRIVDAINEIYAGRDVSFVYLPGDIADDGSASSYRLVRSHLDRLRIPWCGIVGDHDVHEKSFDNFQRWIATDLTSAFTVGTYRFLRLNAFSEPRPDSFLVDDAQLGWIEQELRSCEQQHQRAVLLLHCYPSDLKTGGAALTELIRKYRVLLVDMGHTHYNELSNDGHALYSATRSTGQIEEGPVGFSVVTLDHDTVSWQFVQLESPDLVTITSPADRRLAIGHEPQNEFEIAVRAKAWSRNPIAAVTATLADARATLTSEDGVFWAGNLPELTLDSGNNRLTVEAVTASGSRLSDTIEITAGPRPEIGHSFTDQDNAIGAWVERGILGTQLGPNKNGRKW